jgi:hypothetical protein
MYATKDLLDHVVSIGFDRGSCVAILVGNGSLYSAGRFKLVGCISQRLVLAEFAEDFRRHSEEPAGDEESLLV